MTDRRCNDTKIAVLEEKTKNTDNKVSAIFEILERIESKVDGTPQKIESCQKELTEHKLNHEKLNETKFRVWDIVLTAGLLIVGFIDWFRGGK